MTLPMVSSVIAQLKSLPNLLASSAARSFAALDLMLGALDQVKHQRADGRAVAQPDGTEDVKGKAAQHQDKGKPAGDNVQDIGQYCFHGQIPFSQLMIALMPRLATKSRCLCFTSAA